MTAPTTRTLGRDDWTTPWEVFEPVHHVARFSGDACATDSRAARCTPFLSPEEDALTTPWDQLGERVWCNPPYGREIGRWFARVVDQVAAGRVRLVCMLTFANTDTQYWRDHVALSPHCHAVVFLRPRVRFVLPGDDQTRAGAPKGSALIVYRSKPRTGRWPVHSYADYRTVDWVAASGLAGHVSWPGGEG